MKWKKHIDILRINKLHLSLQYPENIRTAKQKIENR